MPNIEDADIVVDLSGGKLLVKALRKRIEELNTEITEARKKHRDIVCPFCGEGDFDLVGLKYHLKCICTVYHETINLI